MCIDLKDNMLKCDNMKVPFLSESDLPKRLMGARGDGDAMDVEQAGASAGGGGSSAGGQEGGTATGGGAEDPPAAAIDMLTGMGFSRDQAVAALKRYTFCLSPHVCHFVLPPVRLLTAKYPL